MNSSKSSKKSGGSRTIFWWVIWITVTIGSFFVASSFWTPVIAKHFGTVRETKASILWVTAVFGTWMVFLVPLIILMYSKVDKVYEDARIRREKNEKRFRSIAIDPEKRLLPSSVTGKMADWPFTTQDGHLVNLKLKDGRQVENVFVSERKEILGIYNETSLSFEGKDVAEIEPVDLKKAPAYLTNLWLRLDGALPQE